MCAVGKRRAEVAAEETEQCLRVRHGDRAALAGQARGGHVRSEEATCGSSSRGDRTALAGQARGPSRATCGISRRERMHTGTRGPSRRRACVQCGSDVQKSQQRGPSSEIR